MSAQPDAMFGGAAGDPDAQETREWVDALAAVIASEGRERGHFLLERLLERHGSPLNLRDNSMALSLISTCQ